MATCAILAVVGLKALAAPDREAAAPTRADAPVDISASAFAEIFARTYLTWDADGSEQREEALTRMMPRADVASSDGLGRRDQRVAWSLVVADRPQRRRRIVTVAAQTSVGLAHLAVTVARDRRGFLYVPSPPAFVGPPATARDVSQQPERDVEDPELRTVAGRVVTNYLAREREDLRADLDPSAVVSLPEEPLRVAAVEGVTWVTPNRRVAVALTATGAHGLRLALRYELSVTRPAGRWLVRTVHVNPTGREPAG
ncbi:MAG TPA: conjugal transfer protein [Solirubrobacteraceae bacterium]